MDYCSFHQNQMVWRRLTPCSLPHEAGLKDSVFRKIQLLKSHQDSCLSVCPSVCSVVCLLTPKKKTFLRRWHIQLSISLFWDNFLPFSTAINCFGPQILTVLNVSCHSWQFFVEAMFSSPLLHMTNTMWPSILVTFWGNQMKKYTRVATL